MAPGPKARETTQRRRKTKLDWSTCWSNSLKEVAGLLPMTEPRRGRALTKKETLINMLLYFDFLHDKIQNLQSCLPPHCLLQEPDTGSGSESEDNTPSEPCTPPQTLRAKRKYLCSRARKKSTEIKLEVQDERKRQKRERSASGSRSYTFEEDGQSPPMWSMFSDWSDLQPSSSYEQWSVGESDSVPSSMDSAFSLRETLPLPTPLEGNSGVLWSPLGGHCSVCQDLTVSESSPGSVVFDTPPTGPGSLLVKDRMFGLVLPVGVRRLPLLSPAAMSRQPPPLFPLLPLLGAGDSLNLSPSLLTSPARGLNHCLLPEGQEELQALFEDVWVTPKTSHTRVSIRPRHDPIDSVEEEEAVVPPEVWLSSQSEGEEGDATWTPKLQGPTKKTSKGRRRRRRAKAATRGTQRAPPNLKKKCVNGFIMFCRVNRKTYLRSHPGTPSTVVTKELASLWHMMPKQEKRVYCLKARTFSRQQNRNVRIEGMEEEEEEDCVPSPLHMLLAHRDLCAATRGGI
ncbi:uncharacterized protein LOC134039595 isoform X2 [Osmerus eperlanus]|uniref:uncharacterized protein LOC134039595 isoform X2 n=1 Tax=Osmerus eperlanus TaxID=29151 RepID=UPI002E0F2FB8